MGVVSSLKEDMILIEGMKCLYKMEDLLYKLNIYFSKDYGFFTYSERWSD